MRLFAGQKWAGNWALNSILSCILASDFLCFIADKLIDKPEYRRPEKSEQIVRQVLYPSPKRYPGTEGHA
jgi:hypothetical protein